MILVDTNLLIYAAIDDGTREHGLIRPWLEEQFAKPWRVGLPWHSLLGFVRLASDRRIFQVGPSIDDAWDVVRAWLAVPNVWIPEPTEHHAQVLTELFASTKVGAGDVTDAHLVALAIEHGLTLCSANPGFVRYRKLRSFNPFE